MATGQQIAEKITEIKKGLAEAVSNKGVPTASSASFSQITENINQIKQNTSAGVEISAEKIRGIYQEAVKSGDTLQANISDFNLNLNQSSIATSVQLAYKPADFCYKNYIICSRSSTNFKILEMVDDTTIVERADITSTYADLIYLAKETDTHLIFLCFELGIHYCFVNVNKQDWTYSVSETADISSIMQGRPVSAQFFKNELYLMFQSQSRNAQLIKLKNAESNIFEYDVVYEHSLNSQTYFSMNNKYIALADYAKKDIILLDRNTKAILSTQKSYSDYFNSILVTDNMVVTTYASSSNSCAYVIQDDFSLEHQNILRDSLHHAIAITDNVVLALSCSSSSSTIFSIVLSKDKILAKKQIYKTKKGCKKICKIDNKILFATTDKTAESFDANLLYHFSKNNRLIEADSLAIADNDYQLDDEGEAFNCFSSSDIKAKTIESRHNINFYSSDLVQ